MDHQIQAVRLMQDYIKDHINEDISIDAIAKEVSYSAPYARKIFIKHLGITPAVYIRRLKLSISALKLRDEHCQILDVAMETGFGSVVAFHSLSCGDQRKEGKYYERNKEYLYSGDRKACQKSDHQTWDKGHGILGIL